MGDSGERSRRRGERGGARKKLSRKHMSMREEARREREREDERRLKPKRSSKTLKKTRSAMTVEEKRAAALRKASDLDAVIDEEMGLRGPKRTSSAVNVISASTGKAQVGAVSSVDPDIMLSPEAEDRARQRRKRRNYCKVFGVILFIAFVGALGWALFTYWPKDIKEGSGDKGPGEQFAYFRADIWFGAGSGNPANMLAVGESTLLMVATDQSQGRELWSFDTETNTPTLIQDIRPGFGSSDPAELTLVTSSGGVNGSLVQAAVFSANGGTFGRELWSYTVETDELRRLTDLAPGSSSGNPTDLTKCGDAVYFAARNASGANAALWKFVPDVAGGAPGTGSVSLVGGLDMNPSDFAVLPDTSTTAEHLFFAGTQGSVGRELFRLNCGGGGVPAVDTISLVEDLLEGPDSSDPKWMIYYEGRIYFQAMGDGINQDLFAYLPDSDAVVRVATGWGEAGPAHLAIHDRKIYFAAGSEDFGEELWEFDASTGIARLITDINIGPDSSTPRNLQSARRRLFFEATNGDNGRELYTYNPDTGRTVLASDTLPGPGSGNALSPFYFPNNRRLYFGANDGTNGVELWSYNVRYSGEREATTEE